jgi:hypothetical protein
MNVYVYMLFVINIHICIYILSIYKDHEGGDASVFTLDIRKGVENIDQSSTGIVTKTLSDHNLNAYEGYIFRKTKNIFVDFKVLRNDRMYMLPSLQRNS